MGAIAGMAASVTGAVATVGSVAIAVPIGQQFAGTPMPAHLGVLGAVLLGFVLMQRLRARTAEMV
jgi:DHA1 family bicyclomycin/chloramphenicol resistance-like MFS transporter